MRPPGEPAQRACPHAHIKSGGATHKTELIEALVLAFTSVVGVHLFNVGRGQFKPLPRMSLEDVAPVGTLAIRSICLKKHTGPQPWGLVNFQFN